MMVPEDLRAEPQIVCCWDHSKFSVYTETWVATAVKYAIDDIMVFSSGLPVILERHP
jgi:hypothetical protein